jgi:pimeloyl-ACP methyl ester carboxylesterase
MPQLQFGDFTMQYVEHGTGSEPIVFLGGFISSARWWRLVLDRLPDRFHAYALNLRAWSEGAYCWHGDLPGARGTRCPMSKARPSIHMEMMMNCPRHRRDPRSWACSTAQNHLVGCPDDTRRSVSLVASCDRRVPCVTQ